MGKQMADAHKVEIDTPYLVKPRMPLPGVTARLGDKVRFEITVIADNPLSSGSHTLDRLDNDNTTIESARRRLEKHARKVGYAGIAQIADYDTGECVTFGFGGAAAACDDPR